MRSKSVSNTSTGMENNNGIHNCSMDNSFSLPDDDWLCDGDTTITVGTCFSSSTRSLLSIPSFHDLKYIVENEDEDDSASDSDAEENDDEDEEKSSKKNNKQDIDEEEPIFPESAPPRPCLIKERSEESMVSAITNDSGISSQHRSNRIIFPRRRLQLKPSIPSSPMLKHQRALLIPLPPIDRPNSKRGLLNGSGTMRKEARDKAPSMPRRSTSS